MIHLIVLFAFIASIVAIPYTPQPQYLPGRRVDPYHSYQTTVDSQASILRQDQDVNEDGSYSYGYQTGNGITVQEQGGPTGGSGGSAAHGSYSYTSPEGKFISISYIADENGFRAVGDAIPTPPPVPPEIQRALDYIALLSNQEQKRNKYY